MLTVVVSASGQECPRVITHGHCECPRFITPSRCECPRVITPSRCECPRVITLLVFTYLLSLPLARNVPRKPDQ